MWKLGSCCQGFDTNWVNKDGFWKMLDILLKCACGKMIVGKTYLSIYLLMVYFLRN